MLIYYQQSDCLLEAHEAQNFNRGVGKLGFFSVKKVKEVHVRNSKILIDYRCKCGKLLFKGFLLIGVIEIKCKRCGQIMLFQDSNENSLVNIHKANRHVLPKSAQLSFVKYDGKKYVFAIL